MVLKVFDFDLKVYHLDLTGVDSGLTTVYNQDAWYADLGWWFKLSCMTSSLVLLLEM